MGILRAGKVFTAAIFLYTVVSYTHALPAENNEPTPGQEKTVGSPYSLVFNYGAFTEVHTNASYGTKEINICDEKDFVGTETYNGEFVNVLQGNNNGRVNGKQWYSKLLSNIGNVQDCYQKTEYPQDANRSPLSPYTSIRTRDFASNTRLYIKELDGLKVTDTQEHNGCVKVTREFESILAPNFPSSPGPSANITQDNALFLWAYAPIQVEQVLSNVTRIVTPVEKEDCIIQNYEISEDPTTIVPSTSSTMGEVQNNDATAAP